MNYVALKFKLEPIKPTYEILIAELAQFNFDSFQETKDGINAFILEENYSDEILNQISILYKEGISFSYEKEMIKRENWNTNWENNFQPINVENQCLVRAPFHKKQQTEYDIIIVPKMSFGTGHHETTYLMIILLLSMDISGCVLDMGCGTGILAILTEKMGAQSVDAIDIDDWAYVNTLENIEKNKCSNIAVKKGDVHLLKDKKYQTIVANINRNVLLNDIPIYTKHLNENGYLLLSGFFITDEEVIKQICEKNGLKLIQSLEKNNWSALKFVR